MSHTDNASTRRIDCNVAMAGEFIVSFREVAACVDASAFAAFQSGGGHQPCYKELVLKLPTLDRRELAL